MGSKKSKRNPKKKSQERSKGHQGNNADSVESQKKYNTSPGKGQTVRYPSNSA